MKSEAGHERYQRLGLGYASRRQPDPRVARLIEAALAGARSVLNVGAGTGSYEPPDRTVIALEPSQAMLAQRRANAAPALRGIAEHLPFRDDIFDAAMAVLTIHHWADLYQGLRELCRVAPRRVILAYIPDTTRNFWLVRDYLPALGALEEGRPSIDDIAAAIDATDIISVPVPHDCTDGFLGAYWRRPHAYLDPGVQRSISSFGLVPPGSLHHGLARLKADLATGEWHRRYAHLLDLEELDLGYRLLVSR